MARFAPRVLTAPQHTFRPTNDTHHHTMTTTTPQLSPVPPQLPGNVLTFSSDDGLVRVKIKSSGLHRWPAHDYPCVLLELRPALGTRVAHLQDGSLGVEAMLRHSEIRAVIDALNAAAGRTIYSLAEIKDKPMERRARWAAINHARHARS